MPYNLPPLTVNPTNEDYLNSFSSYTNIPASIADLSYNPYDPSNVLPNISPSISGIDTSVYSNTGNPTDFLGSLSSYINKDNLQALGSIAGGVGGLLTAFTGYKQLNQARKAQQANQAFANRNLANQAKLINAQLEDRQRARIGGTGDNNASGQYESLASYMAKNKVNGSPV